MPREARAVDARLLAGTDTDDGAAVRVCDAVRLCELQRERRDDEIGERLSRQLYRGQSELSSTDNEARTSLFLVTMFLKSSASIFASLRFCCRWMP